MDIERAAVLACAGISSGLLVVSVQKTMFEAYRRHSERYTHDATHSLSDLYVFLDLRMLWPTMLWLAVTVFLLVLWCGAGWFLAVLLALACFAIPGSIIRWAKARRLKRFERQLPDALYSISAALAAGTSLSAALQMQVQYAPSPLSQEFSVVARQTRLGMSLENAIQQLMTRMPCAGVQALGATIMVANQTGGPMAQMLGETASSLISEYQVQQKASALMSQGWMQAWVMGSLPFGLMFVMSRMDERFLPLLWGSGIGNLLLVFMAVLEFLGLLWLRRIARHVARG